MPDESSLRAAARRIRLAVFDVDGVFTDGRVYFMPAGAGGGREEIRVFDVQDGLGLKLLQKAGVDVGIISGRRSPLLAERMRELGVRHVHLGHYHKAAAFEAILEETGVGADACACTGDDWPDIPLMQRAGLPIAVPNARPEVKAVARWTTDNPGGRGAVREICDRLIQARGRYDALLADFRTTRA